MTFQEESVSARTNWETPAEIFNPLNDYFKFDLDAAADEKNHKLPSWIDEKGDALSQNWDIVGRTVWLNPPFGRGVEAWLSHADGQRHFGVTTVVLLPARVGSKWWRTWAPAEVHILNSRVKFVGADTGPKFDCAIWVYRPPFPLPSTRWAALR